jgi:hypothetical protein
MEVCLLILQLFTIGYFHYQFKAIAQSVAHLEANVDVTRARIMQHVTAFFNVIKKAINLK